MIIQLLVVAASYHKPVMRAKLRQKNLIVRMAQSERPLVQQAEHAYVPTQRWRSEVHVNECCCFANFDVVQKMTLDVTSLAKCEVEA